MGAGCGIGSVVQSGTDIAGYCCGTGPVVQSTARMALTLLVIEQEWKKHSGTMYKRRSREMYDT